MTSRSAEQAARPRPLGWVLSVVLNIVIGAVTALPFALLATAFRNVVLVPLGSVAPDPAWSDPSGFQTVMAVVASLIAVAVFVVVNVALRRGFRLPTLPYWVLGTVLFLAAALVQLLRPLG